MQRSFLASISNNCTANVEYQLKNPMGGELSTIPARACVISVFVYTNGPVTGDCKFILGNPEEKENYIPESVNVNTSMLNSGKFINVVIPYDVASSKELPIVITFNNDFTSGEICFLFNIIEA